MAGLDRTIVELTPDAAKAIRHALLVGLQSFGEIERVLDRIESASETGIEINEAITPRHPTDDDDTISAFTTALSLLN